MEKIKKTLLMIATGLVGCTAIMVAVTSNSSILETSIAGLSKSNNNDRTLTLNNSTPLSITEGVGTLTVGNMNVRAVNCSSIENGVGRISYDGILIYCNNAGSSASEFTQGFGASDVTSVSLNLTPSRDGEIFITWGRMASDNTIRFYSSDAKYTHTVTEELVGQEQNILINDAHRFVNYQSKAKNNGYSCIYIYFGKSNGTFDLHSLTVQYSCN